MRSAMTRTDRYSHGAILLHWVTAALIVFNLWLGLAHDSLPRDWQVMPVHKALGITVLVLTLVRIAWRFSHPVPPAPTDVPAWQRIAAHVSHIGFYVLLLAIPLSGWAMVSGTETRRPLTWFWLFGIPYLPVSKAVGGIAHEAHELLGFAMIGLIVLHVAAALRHHFILRDNVLARMVPGVKAP